MKTTPRLLLSIPLILCLASAACSPGPLSETDTQSSKEIVSKQTDVSPAGMGVEVLWPDQQGDCITSLPVPSLKLCLSGVSTPNAMLSLPAALLPGVENALLGTLPGGSWSAPLPLSLSGYPGTDSGTAGIIIVNNSPPPDDNKPPPDDSILASGISAAAIIIVNTSEGQDWIVIQNIPSPGSAEGIVIQNKPAGTSGVGLVELSIPGLELGTLVGDQAFSGKILSLDWLNPLEVTQQMSKGVIWGGLVAGVDEDYINASPFNAGVVFRPPPDDNKSAVVWGGIPADAIGIIIVNNFPGPDQSTEGIILFQGNDASQLMSIISEGKPASDNGAEGIVIQNKPAEFHTPGISLNAMAWVNQVDVGEGNQGIIIIENMPAVNSQGASASSLGFPGGFDLPEGMTPFLGDTGFGPGPFAILSLDLNEFEGTSDQQGCYQIALDQLLSTESEGFQVDSFFDVFTELTVGFPREDQSGELALISASIPFPNYTLCTPGVSLPSDTPEAYTTLPTPTPRSTPVPPTPTTRTGLPTKTPNNSSRLPTSTPKPSR